MADDDGAFIDYHEDSADPGSSIVIATIIFSFLLVAVIPLFISATERCNDSRRRSEEDASSTSSVSSTEAGDKHEVEPTNSMRKQSALGIDSSVKPGPKRWRELAKAIVNAVQDAGPYSGINLKRLRSPGDFQENEELDTGGERQERCSRSKPRDAQSAGAPSALSKLDNDEVSIQDAIDAHDGVKVNTLDMHKSNENVPGWRPSAWAANFNRLLDIAEYDHEMRRLCELSVPLIAEALVRGFLDIANIALIGHFLSTSALVAYVTVDRLVRFSALFFKGFGGSVMPLCSEALAKKNKKLAGQYLQLSVLLLLVLFMPMVIFWTTFMPGLLRWFSFDDTIVSQGSEFTTPFACAILIDSVLEIVHAFLDVINKDSFRVITVLLADVLRTSIVLAIVRGSVPTLRKVGLVFWCVSSSAMVFTVFMIMWQGWLDPYLEGLFRSFALRNWKTVILVLQISAASSVSMVLTCGHWGILTFFAKFLGPAEVAAWAMLVTLWEASANVSESVSKATEVRVAMLLGVGQPVKAQMSAYKSIYLGMFISLSLSSFLFVTGYSIPTWLTRDATLRSMLEELIPLLGIGTIASAIGFIAAAAVGTQGRHRLVASVGFGGIWLVTIPLAAIFTVVLNINLQGQTAAAVIGCMVTGAINLYFVFLSDWEKLSIEFPTFACQPPCVRTPDDTEMTCDAPPPETEMIMC